MRVTTEAGQQEVKIGKFGDPVWADVVASAVGQGVDSLSCWTHLKKEKKKKEKRAEISCAYKTHFISHKPFFFRSILHQAP